jgi:hypothetical protein
MELLFQWLLILTNMPLQNQRDNANSVRWKIKLITTTEKDSLPEGMKSNSCNAIRGLRH